MTLNKKLVDLSLILIFVILLPNILSFLVSILLLVKYDIEIDKFNFMAMDMAIMISMMALLWFYKKNTDTTTEKQASNGQND
jgi:hypothetical protein